jgi:RNA polymerase sigma-70 factor, ECF subfamily
LHSARAEFLRRIDRTDEARAVYELALALVDTDYERLFVERRLVELGH